MFIYFALPMAFNDLRIDPFSAAVVATIMINPALISRKLPRRSTIHSQSCFREAGLALGLSRRETIRHEFYRLLCAVCRRRWAISGSLARKRQSSLFIVIGVAS